MKTRRKYEEQFKKDAVALVKTGQKKMSDVARNLGIDYSQLARWCRETNDISKKAFTGNGNSRDEQLAQLQKEIKELKLERDILKKAVAIFCVNGK